MNTRKAFGSLAIVASGILACASAIAGPVHFSFQGSVSGYVYDEVTNYLSAELPVGAAVDISLDFNETFSDGTYDFSDNIDPVSGTMSVGSANFLLNDAQANQYWSDSSGVTSVKLQFLGTGPSIGTGQFYGLLGRFTPGLTLVDDPLLWYGFTQTFDNGVSVTSYKYATLTADRYSITPISVPEPATLSLMLAGLLTCGVSMRARRRS